MQETQTFAATSEAERSLLLPRARCRSAPAVLVTDPHLDSMRVRGHLGKDTIGIFNGAGVLRQAREGRREIAGADREILLSDINNMIEACGRLTAEIAGEVARMQAEDLEMERLDACRVGLQDYGWENLSKALPLTTDDRSVAFYRLIGPVLTKKVYDALVVIARQQCGPAVASFHAAERLLSAEGPQVKSFVHNGVELCNPRRESVQAVLQQVADEDLIEAVLTLLPKSSFSGESFTMEEALAELRERLEASGN
ncbi:hypothetical protein OF846_001503 [Rhodotorula toruloides]|nr:hypothetical protein OF846_001503 [Rhodotorula toruloides]